MVEPRQLVFFVAAAAVAASSSCVAEQPSPPQDRSPEQSQAVGLSSQVPSAATPTVSIRFEPDCPVVPLGGTVRIAAIACRSTREGVEELGPTEVDWRVFPEGRRIAEILDSETGHRCTEVSSRSSVAICSLNTPGKVTIEAYQPSFNVSACVIVECCDWGVAGIQMARPPGSHSALKADGVHRRAWRPSTGWSEGQIQTSLREIDDVLEDDLLERDRELLRSDKVMLEARLALLVQRRVRGGASREFVELNRRAESIKERGRAAPRVEIVSLLDAVEKLIERTRDANDVAALRALQELLKGWARTNPSRGE